MHIHFTDMHQSTAGSRADDTANIGGHRGADWPNRHIHCSGTTACSWWQSRCRDVSSLLLLCSKQILIYFSRIYHGQNQHGHDFGHVYTAKTWTENVENPLLAFAATVFRELRLWVMHCLLTNGSNVLSGKSMSRSRDAWLRCPGPTQNPTYRL